MKLIVGLGNPGSEYEGNRHNVGFMVVDRLCSRLRTSLTQDKFEGRLGQVDVSGERIYLLQPQTFMNLSGRSAGAAARFFKIAIEDVLVIHDEVDLPFGRIQLKNGGGSGGHNGLKSMTDSVGGDGYGRLRIGVGKPEGPGAKERVPGYVLSDFRGEEAQELPFVVDRAADAADGWLRFGMAKAMNQFNKKP